MKRFRESDAYLSRARARRIAKRNYELQRIALLRSKKARIREELKNYVKTYHSIPIDLLTKHSSKRWGGSKEIMVRIPSTFSVIKNPKNTVETFLQFSEAARSARVRKIFFDHSELKDVDLAAESVLDLIAIEYEKENKTRRKKLAIGGAYPKDQSLKRYLRAIGIVKNLDIKHEFLPSEEEEKLKTFQMRNKKLARAHSVSDADYKERAVADFVKHIDECLHSRNKKLTPEAKTALSLYTGEILDNVEEHTDIDDWTIVGYLDTSSSSKICEIAIFNFGKTFAETFKTLPNDSFARAEITPYLDAHRKKGLFGKHWHEDDLLTLVALQDNISSKNKKAEDDRGTGTVQLIEFFQRIHSEWTSQSNKHALMCILSGNTHILFDGKYHMSPDHSGRMIIAFNANNDLNDEPDKSCITNLGETFFPGTIISIVFSLQDTQTEEISNFGP